ncbi:MAG: thiol:disulfide interchange protein DsbA [Enterobacterales bacterium]|jgi:thiol:disulfide interchange protein DsbA
MSSKSTNTVVISILMTLAVMASLTIETKLFAANESAVFAEGRDFVTKFPYEKPKKPQLVEFFSFMCPACFKRETMVLRWKKQKPDSVELLKIPVSFGRPSWKLAARAFYIAEELNVSDKFSKVMFQKIHIDNVRLGRLADIEKIFIEMGISKADFKKAASSFAVDSKLRKAEFLAKKYKVPSVPHFLVNFKYEASATSSKTQESLFRLWNLLPARDF